jgi:hypothetical protein
VRPAAVLELSHNLFLVLGEYDFMGFLFALGFSA